MVAKLIEVLVMEGIAALMFFFAYQIGLKQNLHLIAGYNDRSAASVHDKPGLARLVARVCLVVGVASGLMPLATTFWGGTAVGFASVTGGYAGFIVGVVALTALQARECAGTKVGSGRATPGREG